MGYIKSKVMEEEARGFRSVSDRYACPECVGEPALSELARTRASSPQCDYCGRVNQERLVGTSVDIILEAIADGLNAEYGDAADELPWEREYLGVTMDTLEVLEDAGCDISSDELRDEIVKALIDRAWCRLNYFRLRDSEALIAGWDKFTELVTHRTRYFFIASRDTEGIEGDPEVPGAADTLKAIGQVVNEVELVHQYPSGTHWTRARSHGPGERFTTAAELGPPPTRWSAANRMSAAGIPMFYGSREKTTAMLEVAAVPQNARDPLVTIGTFITARPSLLVDLTNLPPVPSLFDENRRHLRESIRFLARFAERISQPISRDGTEHIEYVPTQIVTEWFRHVFAAEDGKHIEGIVYPSARNPGGVCCVIFADAEAFCDTGPGWESDTNKVAALGGVETLVMHRGYQAFRSSPEIATLRAEGLRILGRIEPFDSAEWNEFIRLPRSNEYEEFCAQCSVVAARFDLMEYVVRRACLVRDYDPASEPFVIEAARPQALLVADPRINPRFSEWLLYAASHLGLRVAYRDKDGLEAIVVSLPSPIAPSDPLDAEHRPPPEEAFAVHLDIPSEYPAAAASVFAEDIQLRVHRLLEFLGYPSDRWGSVKSSA